VDRFRQVGNAAGMGAVGLLTSRRARQAIQELAASVTHIELTAVADFKSRYIKALWL
jgi:uncharacterized 2Fe-2S/4Fe-4S cluster protein (DUF4445 family)